MESLYRKYRPQTFGDVVGQAHVVSTLEHAIQEDRISHAYLFCGPRGTGKTTMARLVSKALLCRQGPGQLPDGTCEQCVQIAEGEHPDVYELDAASRTGVDNVREEIINRVNFAPAKGHYKIYIIDEVHMLTTAAFNALLKTLEEPPAHVVFILCTTDPQKIPETILSRVQRFDFRAISLDDLEARLEYVCEQEGFSFDKEALQLVCRHARGGMRDALSLLEQLSVFGDGTISLDITEDLLGGASASQLQKTVEALARKDIRSLFSIVEHEQSSGSDLLQFTRDLAWYVRNIFVVASSENPSGLLDVSQAELERLKELADLFDSEQKLSTLLVDLGKTADRMRFAANRRLILEISFTRMTTDAGGMTSHASAPEASSGGNVGDLECRVTGIEALIEQLQQQNAQLVQALRTFASAPAAMAALSPSVSKLSAGSLAQPAQAGAGGFVSNLAEPQKAVASSVSAPATAQSKAVVAPQPAGGRFVAEAPKDKAQWQRLWDSAIARIKANRCDVSELLEGSQVQLDDGETLVIKLCKDPVFISKMLARDDMQRIIMPEVNRSFGHRILSFVESSMKHQAIAESRKRFQANISVSADNPSFEVGTVPTEPEAPALQSVESQQIAVSEQVPEVPVQTEAPVAASALATGATDEAPVAVLLEEETVPCREDQTQPVESPADQPAGNASGSMTSQSGQISSAAVNFQEASIVPDEQDLSSEVRDICAIARASFGDDIKIDVKPAQAPLAEGEKTSSDEGVLNRYDEERDLEIPPFNMD